MEIKELFPDMKLQDWLNGNANLQRKKNALRAELKERGVMKRGAVNKFDNYSYFSEAQYKELFTELFSKHGLEFRFEELEYELYTGTEKQANGRRPKLRFYLIDVETGFYETTVITGEGIDKGDKAGYKAYTGALKYYLANTFMVATGDDPETDSLTATNNKRYTAKATSKQLEIIAARYTGDNLQKLLDVNGITELKDLPLKKASEIISKLDGMR